MKKFNRLILSSICIILFLAASVLPVAATELVSSNVHDNETQILQYTQEYIEMANAEYYTFQRFEGDVHFVEIDISGKFIADISATMYMTLKAKEVQELPAIKAMLDEVNLNYSQINVSDLDELTTEMEKSNPVDSYKAMQAVRQIQYTADNAKQYIGVENDFNYSFKMVGSFNNGQLEVERFLFLEGLRDYYDAEVIIRDSYDTMYQQTKAAFWNEVSELQVTKEEEITIQPTAVISRYNRLTARDYANQYTSNPYSWRPCSACGNSYCDAKTWIGYYNPAYRNYGHVDCMNFVSQALNAGGMARTSAWSPGTSAWISCTAFYKYANGTYMYKHSFASAAAGGIKLLRGRYHTSSNPDYDHAEMIVLNDTVNRQASAHSRDKYKEVYTLANNYDYFTVYTSIVN